MPEYLAPGVFVEEVSGGAKPIESVSTSTACFIGFTEKAELTRVIDRQEYKESVVRKPLLVTSWEEYRATFGSFVPGIYTPLSIYGFFENGGKRCYVVSIAQLPRKINQVGFPVEEPKAEFTADDESNELLTEAIAAVNAANGAREAAETAEQAVHSAREEAATKAQNAEQQAKRAKVAVEIANATMVAAERAGAAARAAAAAAQSAANDEAANKAAVAANNAKNAQSATEAKAQTARASALQANAAAATAAQAVKSAQERVQWAEQQAAAANAAADEAAQAAAAAKRATQDEAALAAAEEQVAKRYLTVTARQVTSDMMYRVQIKPVARQQSQGEAQYELTVERELQSVPVNVADRWKKIETRYFWFDKKNGDELAIKYQSDVAPQFVDLTVGPTLKANIASALTLYNANKNGLQVPIAINSREIEPVTSKTLIGGDESTAGSIVDSLADIDDISILCMPDLQIPLKQRASALFDGGSDVEGFARAIQQMLVSHCENMGDRVAILDAPPNLTPQEIKNWRMNVAGYDSSYATLYYPWIKVLDPATNEIVEVPPSGHVAGVWARTDVERGVHKAPANEVLRGAVQLAYDVSQRHQEILNPDGINCIRFFPGRGFRIWGARTLSSDPEWRYLNVRRLFNMIKQSIQRGTQWAVFEPNDQRLWAKLRRDVGNFLMGLYSQGMLFGATAGQAYFVKCDIENNPVYTRDLGQLFVDIGVAPVKPAEFVIFRIRQWSPEAEA